jgi:hypothetical protein
MTLRFFVWKIAPVSSSRPPAISHLLPASRLVDSCGSTSGLFWLFCCVLRLK